MPALEIPDARLAALQGSVVVVTGGSSGIGLATVHKLLDSGALVVSGDVNEPPEQLPADRFSFHRTDVACWAQLVALFKAARARHGRIDHVFANAGISNYRKESCLECELDGAGDPVEPDQRVLQVNLVGVMNTARLAVHHFRTQDRPGGSIVITGSGASYSRFGLSDYSASKHGVLGFMRSLHDGLARVDCPIRVNLVAPAFTNTAIIEAAQVLAWGFPVQPPEIVARSVVYLMATETCNQQVVASVDSQYWEVEGELLTAGRTATGGGLKRSPERPGNSSSNSTGSTGSTGSGSALFDVTGLAGGGRGAGTVGGKAAASSSAMAAGTAAVATATPAATAAGAATATTPTAASL